MNCQLFFVFLTQINHQEKFFCSINYYNLSSQNTNNLIDSLCQLLNSCWYADTYEIEKKIRKNKNKAEQLKA